MAASKDNRTLQVTVENRQRLVKIDRPLTRKAVRAAAPDAWRGVTVSVVVVDDAQITDLNQRFLGKRGPTDVLAFPLQGPDGSARPTIGEVVVSAERAAAEAKARGLPVQDELCLYAIHGVLHLCGYDDHTPAARRVMCAREADALEASGLGRAASQRRPSSS